METPLVYHVNLHNWVFSLPHPDKKTKSMADGDVYENVNKTVTMLMENWWKLVIVSMVMNNYKRNKDKRVTNW